MLFYTLAFVVPGFILNNTVSTFVPPKSDQPQGALLRYLHFSCINYAVWSWVIYLLVKTDYPKSHPVRTASIWTTIILISPVVLGIVAGFVSEKELVRKALQKLGFNPAHIIPTGWDYRFSKTMGDSWITVTLKDSAVIHGKFGPKSFASSDASDRDLYIEEVYTISDTNEWGIVPGTDGVLIRGDQIQYIEFQKESERDE